MKRYIHMLIPLLLLSGGCTEEDSSRVVRVTLANAVTSVNEAGDRPFDFCTGNWIGYRTDAGEMNSVKGTVVLSGKMTASFRVRQEAGSLWCYGGGSTGLKQTFTVPSSRTKESSDTASDFEAMAYCSAETSIDGRDNADVTLNPLTAGVILNVLDSEGKSSGQDITSVVVEAEDGTMIAGDISLSFGPSGSSSVSNGSPRIEIRCSNIKVGTETEPALVGAVLLPCSFTGSITVTGPGYTSMIEIDAPQDLSAGYVKSIPVDLADARESGLLKIGVLGDSISSFEGMIPSGYRFYYPKEGCDVDTWEKTYWGLLITQYWKGVLDANCSYSGGCVAPREGQLPDSDFITRVKGLKDPDIVLLHGGTNDASNSVGLGSFDYDSPLESLDTENRFRDSYIAVIRYIRTNYPDAGIVIVIGDHVTGAYGDSVKEIAGHFGLPVVDFRGDDKVSKYSTSHPDASGMAHMARRIHDETLDVLF